jgi:hypothetical protein
MIVIALNLAFQGVAVTMLRRPLAADLELNVGDVSSFTDENRATVESVHRQAVERGFRWFGVAMTRTLLDRPPQPTAI